MPKALQRDNGWINVRGGRRFWPLDPERAEIHPDDLAWALGAKCRFTGYCDSFYSVAQHSVIMSRKLYRKALQRWALVHDAGEAYLPDIAAHLKRAFYVRLPSSGHIVPFDEVEDHILSRVVRQYNLPWPMPGPIRLIDIRMVVTEKRDLLVAAEALCQSPPLHFKPYRERIIPWSPGRAQREFRKRFKELFNE